MLKIKEAIIVEGRYDKNTLSQMVDTLILTTEGFGIFKDKEKVGMLKRIAEQRGIVVLTDSDGAGFVIRNYLKGCLPAKTLKQAYIPDIYGKEKRKRSPGKEGKIGVEGMRPEVLEEVLKKAGATIVGVSGSEESGREITKSDLFRDGFVGKPDSGERRAKLYHELELPERLTAKALPDVLNALMTYEEYRELVQKLND